MTITRRHARLVGIWLAKLALKHLRTVRKGDQVLVYHTGDVKAAVGLAKIAKGPYPDPKAGDPRLVVVEIVPDRALARPVHGFPSARPSM